MWKNKKLQTRSIYNCSFCGKSQDQVVRLIAGPGGVYICNECTNLCREIIEEEQTLPQWHAEKAEKTAINEVTNAAYEAVRQAVLDYVEGIYEVDPTKVERSVHPNLNKGGFFGEKEGSYNFTSMTFAELIEASKNYNKDGKMPKDAPKEIIIYDVLEQIATAKLTAWWGTDYIHLAKYNNKWMIINILWQMQQNNKLYNPD